MAGCSGAVLAGALPGGCSPAPTFQDADPNRRLAALEGALVRDDRSAIPEIITLLDSDDPAVRLFSIRALERMTGTTLGYDHAAAPLQRRQAADRWQAWYQQQVSSGDL